MGNYAELEFEFIERTLALLSQYENIMYKYQFENQYNHTLIINCMLGLIVLPKELTITAIPKARLTKEFLKEMGLENSEINENINDLRELIIALRHSIAHFDIKVESHNDEFLIDEIVFNGFKEETYYQVIRFQADELLPFLRYYGTWILSNYNLINAHKKIIQHARKPSSRY